MNATIIDAPDTCSSTLTPTQTARIPNPHVVVRGSGTSFFQEILCGTHRLQADEPVAAGGHDAAPDPHDYLMAALGACTSMMTGLHARNKKWPLETIEVSLRHSRIAARDCAECRTEGGMVDRIDVDVNLTGPLSADQHAELMRVAANCPIHRALTGEINVRLRAVRSDPVIP
ncbi:MAG TPA: OsmC family protein [Chthoniobacterales bacterium]|nr:OsmC family protein [Chthoniobacterales bacterium]